MSGFVSGLVCGEGSFVIAIAKQPTCRLGYHVRAFFSLEMHVCDAGLMKKVRDFFGFGGINYPQYRVRREQPSPTCRFFATSIPDCQKLVEFFRASPLIGAKQKSFEIWAQCVEIIARGEHTASEGFNKIVKLREKMNQFRQPSTYRNQATINSTVIKTANGRKLKSWLPVEETYIRQYIAGQLNRPELDKILGRSLPSISNKIKRMRQAHS